MALLPIIEVPDPRLRLVSERVDAFDDSLATLVDDMFETMYEAPGIGLAAIQVAVPKRVVVIDLQEREGGEAADGEAAAEPVRNPRVFINPEISWSSAELSSYNEGCLSIPEQFGEVERPARIRAHWQERDGSARAGEIDGLLATCLQHEIDHLNGVLFLDHLSRLKRDMLLKKLDKIRRTKAA